MTVAGERRLRFWRERSTNNMHVYKEEYARGDRPVVGTLYVSKDSIEAMGNPTELEVTIRPA